MLSTHWLTILAILSYKIASARGDWFYKIIHLVRSDFLHFSKVSVGFPLSINVFFTLLNCLLVSFHINTERVSSSIQKFQFCIANDVIKLGLKSFSSALWRASAPWPLALTCWIQRPCATCCKLFKKLDSYQKTQLRLLDVNPSNSQTFFLRRTSIVESTWSDGWLAVEQDLVWSQRLNQCCYLQCCLSCGFFRYWHSFFF